MKNFLAEDIRYCLTSIYVAKYIKENSSFIINMEGKLMADDNEAKPIPEPPKFNLEDLPEPPTLNSENKAPNITGNTDTVIPPPPDVNTPQASILPPPAKKGFFSKLFGKKPKEEKEDIAIPPPVILEEEKEEVTVDLKPSTDDSFAPPELENASEIELPPQIDSSFEAEKSHETSLNDLNKDFEDEDWYEEGKNFQKEEERIKEAEKFREHEMLEEGEKFLEKIPVTKVKGVGPARAKKLKKAGIKHAGHLAKHDHKKLAKKAKIPEAHAKEIISNAKKIAKIRSRLKETKIKSEQGISAIVKQLESERKTIEKLQKESGLDEDKLIQLEGHKDLINVLEKLESRRKTLTEQEEKLAEKETKLAAHDDTYRREVEQIEKLRRRLDHDVRERTQYLINLEKEYFQKAQILAKKQSEVEVKEKEIEEKSKFFKEKELSIKSLVSELEDRTISIQAKEQKFEKIMKELEKQDTLLKEKEDDLLKRESEYMKKLDALETHEKVILKDLEDKRKRLESKEKEIEIREKRVHTKERTIDKKSVAVEYAQNILEEEKNKLVDDEFEQYLHEQLGMAKESNISVTDMNMVKGIPTNVKGNSIYDLVDTCRDLIKSNRVNDAKIFYNQIRDRYYGSSLTGKEKEAIHNMLRTLYDEINLADIGRNR
jgi:nucleotidyltransferase/DNA polymerase involved in DNA repair